MEMRRYLARFRMEIRTSLPKNTAGRAATALDRISMAKRINTAPAVKIWPERESAALGRDPRPNVISRARRVGSRPGVNLGHGCKKMIRA